MNNVGHSSSSINDMSVGDRIFIVGLFVAAVAIPVTVIALHFVGLGSESAGVARCIMGGIFAFVTIAIATLNVHLSFTRPWLHRRRHGNMDDYRHVSGAPLLGSITAFIAAVTLPGHVIIGILLLLFFLIDTGGVHFAAYCFARYRFGADRPA